GNGGAVTVQSTSVLSLGAQRIITFQIPPALTVNQPVACQVTVAGTQPAVYSSTPSSSAITINPPPTVTSVSPGVGTRGVVVNNISIVGNFTHFTATQPTQPVVTVGGAGVAVTNVVATDSTHLTATFTVDPAAVA